MTQKLISMTEKELSRYNIIKRLIDDIINGTDASKQMGISIRHVKRLKLKVKRKGAEGLIHGNRGQSNKKLDIVKIEKYLKEKYYDFGPTLASEKLEELHQIKISKESVRALMTSMKLWKPKSRKRCRKWHVWRARRDNYGEMQQFDGSYHIWFGNKESCLLLSVDDATGKITYAKFDYNEGIIAVFNFWLEYFEKHGFPLSIYLDRFSTYKINHKKAVDNKELKTQFQRATNQVGVELITAYSPEAKGRVERMFGTLQDRLVKELKLAGITTIEEANRFLKEYVPRFNDKFSVVPQRKNNLHKELSEVDKVKLSQIFSIQSQRIVNNDYTIRFKSDYYQLDRIQPTTVFKKDTVIIEERLDGEVKINLRDNYLNYVLLPERPLKEINIKLPALTITNQSSWKPPKDHPWREKFPQRKSTIREPVLVKQ